MSVLPENPPSMSEGSTSDPTSSASSGGTGAAARRVNPERLALRGSPRPVTRLNRTTIAVLAGGLATAALGFALWGLGKHSSDKGSASEAPRNVDRISRAEGLDTLPRDYGSLPKAPKLGAPIGELGRPILRAEQEAGLPPMPERPSFAPNPEEDALRTQRLRLQEESEAAAKAQVLVQLKQRTAGADHPNAAAELGPVPGAAAPNQPTNGNGAGAQDRKNAFVHASTDARIYASGSVETPRSPFQLMAGTVIAGALQTGINSDLPGQVIATVTENVYDSLTGRTLLVPQGARLLGQYDSQVTYGQRRVLLVWTRLIMPDGSSIVLDRLPGLDTAGQSGLEDGVDWHLDRLASGAALSTLLGVAAQLASPDQTGANGILVIGAKQGVQDTINQAGQEITRRNLDIQPTLRIRPGFPLRIMVNKDLILRPYEA